MKITPLFFISLSVLLMLIVFLMARPSGFEVKYDVLLKELAICEEQIESYGGWGE